MGDGVCAKIRDVERCGLTRLDWDGRHRGEEKCRDGGEVLHFVARKKAVCA